MNSIPPEMWDKILSYLPLRDLRSCSRLNKKLSSEAIRNIDKLSKISLENQRQLYSYMDYILSGGRLHKNIHLHLSLSEMERNEGEYRYILRTIESSVQYCSFTLKKEDEIVSRYIASLRITEYLLDKVLNLCPNFHLIIDPNTCPEYILEYFAEEEINFFTSIQIIFTNEGFNQAKHNLVKRILSNTVCLHRLLFFLKKPTSPPNLLQSTFASLSEDRQLRNLESIGMLLDGATMPRIFEDRRLALKHLAVVAFSSALIFNGDVERLISHHAASLEGLTLFYPDIKNLDGISSFQLPELPKLNELDLSSRREDSFELDFPPYFPILPSKFPPSLNRIRIKMQFHDQKLLEKQIKGIFRHHWEQDFPQIRYFELSECYCAHPVRKIRVGNRILGKFFKMFPRAEIRIRDERIKQKFVVSRLGKREKLGERKR